MIKDCIEKDAGLDPVRIALSKYPRIVVIKSVIKILQKRKIITLQNIEGQVLEELKKQSDNSDYFFNLIIFKALFKYLTFKNVQDIKNTKIPIKICIIVPKLELNIKVEYINDKLIIKEAIIIFKISIKSSILKYLKDL